MKTQATGAISVLVVDDDPSIQTMIRAVLRRQKMEVEIASNGSEALVRIRRRNYDVILLDLMMPDRNGFEVIAELKSVAPAMLKHVIVVTAASDRTLEALDRDEVRALLRKPFDIDVLTAEIVACTRDVRTAHDAA